MIQENLNTYIKEAMLAKDETKVRTFRFIKAEFMNYTTAKNAKPLDEAAEVGILRKMINERLDAAGQYSEAGREDLADKEIGEVVVLRTLLPKTASKEEIEEFADSIITERGMKFMGAYVKQVKNKFPTADGKLIAEIIKSKIS